MHDVSDVFVDLLKMVNYLKLEDRRGYFASELAYLACVVAWLYWRLYEFPFRVIRGASYEAYRMIAPQPSMYAPLSLASFTVRELPFWFELNVLLLTLQALHVYWGHLFLMIGYRILTESAREASRQEYEGACARARAGAFASPSMVLSYRAPPPHPSNR